MMWLSILLFVTWAAGPDDAYWRFVEMARTDGCRVLNQYYVACDGVEPPPGAIAIPPDAVEVFGPIVTEEKPKPGRIH